ncbi:MAG TPA: hypothetical protein VI358_12905 [Pseudolabrys sp.]
MAPVGHGRYEFREDGLALLFGAQVLSNGETVMISLDDCIAFCGLNEDEVAAISEHEHIPEIAATALADYLLKQPHGGETIRTMIIDDIHKALDAGRVKHAQELFMALRHFLDQHPEARTGVEA